MCCTAMGRRPCLPIDAGGRAPCCAASGPWPIRRAACGRSRRRAGGSDRRTRCGSWCAASGWSRTAVRARRPEEPDNADDSADESSEEESWRAALLGILREMKPDAFERLCQRLLREHGFTRVEVTGRSGDGGIDGTGVLRVNLLSFHVNYQCKRYAGTVGPGSIRDFRGALAGRADKGLFITTGRFTKDAERGAIRDGAMAIDLINGDELCGLLRDKGLGVVTETVERVTPDPSFFDAL